MQHDPDSSNADRTSAYLRDQHGFVLTYRQAHTDPVNPVLRLLWRHASEAVALTDDIATRTAMLERQDRFVADLIAAEQETAQRTARIPATRNDTDPTPRERNAA